MSEQVFEPIGEINNDSYRARMVARQVMPTAIVCVRSAQSGDVYSVTTGNRPSGFPTTDLGNMRIQQPPRDYLTYKLRKRFGLRIPRNQMQVVPYVSSPSPYVESLGNDLFPDLHHRQYFPFLAVVEDEPTSGLLTPMTPNQVPHNVVCAGGPEALEHFSRVHAEIMERFAGIELT